MSRNALPDKLWLGGGDDSGINRLTLGIPAGIHRDPDGQAGVAAATARLLFGHEQEPLRRSLRERASLLTARAGRRFTVIQAACWPDNAAWLLETLQSAMSAFAPSDAAWRSLTESWSRTARSRSEESSVLAHRLFRQGLYGPDHAWSRGLEPGEDDLGRFGPDDCREFHRRWYASPGAFAAAVGDWDAAALLRCLGGGEREPGACEPRALPAPRAGSTRARCDSSGSTIVLGSIGPDHTAPDYPAALLANALLGDLTGMGRIGLALRDAGLAYDSSVRLGGCPWEPWAVTVSVPSGDPERAVRIAADEIRRLAETPPPPDELRAAAARARTRLAVSLDGPSGEAFRWMVAHSLGLPEDWPRILQQAVPQVAASEVSAVTARYLSADRLFAAIAEGRERT